jgi:hypothetical protein
VTDAEKAKHLWKMLQYASAYVGLLVSHGIGEECAVPASKALENIERALEELK